MMHKISNHYCLYKEIQHMNTVQEEEEIKYIPEGAKCTLDVGLHRSHYLFTGAQENSLIDKFPTYSGFGTLFPLKKPYPSYSVRQGRSKENTGAQCEPIKMSSMSKYLYQLIYY